MAFANGRRALSRQFARLSLCFLRFDQSSDSWQPVCTKRRPEVVNMWLFMAMLMLASGSEDPAIAVSRQQQWERAREEKAGNLRKPERTFLETTLHEVRERRVIERFQEGIFGFRPLLGGLQTGSGFAAGTSFEQERWRASAQASLKGYQKYELQFSSPLFAGSNLFADARATYRNAPQESFFGIGESSREENRTNYRLEDTNYLGRFGYGVAKHVRAGVLGGWLETHIGSGTSEWIPSIEQNFGTDAAPAIDKQPRFSQAGAFLEIDYRDEPNNPRSGGRYSAQWISFNDLDFNEYDFGQYDIEVNQYFPFLNERRVFAIRGKTTMTRTAPGRKVPFFMQRTLGGANDLRGFREHRFQDNNVVVVNAEYRWEAFSGLDLAVFADAGQVAAKPTDIDFADLQKSYGFGFRFNTAKSVFLRMDVGLSEEGRQFFLKFSHVF
jgi:hypothetical protein